MKNNTIIYYDLAMAMRLEPKYITEYFKRKNYKGNNTSNYKTMY